MWALSPAVYKSWAGGTIAEYMQIPALLQISHILSRVSYASFSFCEYLIISFFFFETRRYCDWNNIQNKGGWGSPKSTEQLPCTLFCPACTRKKRKEKQDQIADLDSLSPWGVVLLLNKGQHSLSLSLYAQSVCICVLGFRTRICTGDFNKGNQRVRGPIFCFSQRINLWFRLLLSILDPH